MRSFDQLIKIKVVFYKYFGKQAMEAHMVHPLLS
jgi:hypothetical protein